MPFIILFWPLVQTAVWIIDHWPQQSLDFWTIACSSHWIQEVKGIASSHRGSVRRVVLASGGLPEVLSSSLILGEDHMRRHASAIGHLLLVRARSLPGCALFLFLAVGDDPIS